MRVQNALGWSLRDHLTPHPPQPTVAMFCAEMFHAVGPQGFSKPYRFSPGGRTGFGPAFTTLGPSSGETASSANAVSTSSSAMEVRRWSKNWNSTDGALAQSSTSISILGSAVCVSVGSCQCASETAA